MKKLEGISKIRERDTRLRLRYNEKLGVISDLRGNLVDVGGKDGKALREAGLRFVKAHPDLFGNVGTAGLRVLQETTDPHGGRSVSLQQYHGRHRVYGGSIRFHANQRGVIDTVNNRLFPDLKDVAREPRLGVERAVVVAQRSMKCASEPARKPEVLVYRHDGKPRLAWEVRLNDVKPGARGVPAQWVAYVDALSGKLLQFYDNAQTAGPTVGSGTGHYSGTAGLNTWFDDTTYLLRDTTRVAAGGPEIVTNDEEGASPSEDPDNDWNAGTTSPRDQNQGAEVDAHRYAGKVADYYRTVHGRNSFDDAGASLVTLVHFQTDLSNGYWDGTKVNLGDGSGVAATGDDYECSDDWLAHEFTHAYTEHTCGLQYVNEPGALNEAFSDVFAAFITGDWLVFEDTWLKSSAPAWRNMMDPTNGGLWDGTDPENSVLAGHQPSHYGDRYTGTWDFGGVHINSGIINNLFYLLTVGGTHAVSGVSVTGIGQPAAERILFRCMTDNLAGNPTASFLDFRVAMLDACQDLFPTDLMKLTQVKNAFNAVGIGPDLYVRDNTADTGAEPYPGAYLYASPDIINRTSASSDPASDFADMADDSLWENIEYGQDNFIYVRLQNRGAADGDAEINLYFSEATTFGAPGAWTHIGTLSETGIAPGSVRIAGPLTFPSALIPSPGHYCVIAVVSDALDPAPDLALISSVSDYLSFVRNSNNIAYRNMDIVDLVPGSQGVVDASVQAPPGSRERFYLLIDLGRFVPGARVRVRGPAVALDGAVPVGLRLIGRKAGQNMYEVLAGKDRRNDLAFHGLADRLSMVGFADVLVEKKFRVAVDYALPDRDALRGLKRGAPRSGYVLALRQEWNGETVGVVSLRLRAKGAFRLLTSPRSPSAPRPPSPRSRASRARSRR